MALMGCGLCGLSVGILWPGTFSLSCAPGFPGAGTAMAALLALGGTWAVPWAQQWWGWCPIPRGSIRSGLLAAVVFPVLCCCA